MYTEGIRKILCIDIHYRTLDKLQEIADSFGTKAIAHNGDIFVKSKETWVKTPFQISDFST